EIMKDVRNSISLQGYAQRNPLIEYKNAAFSMFTSFINSVDRDIVKKLFAVTKVTKAEQQQQQLNLQTNSDEITDILTGDREIFAGESKIQRADKLVQSIERNAARQRLQTN